MPKIHWQIGNTTDIGYRKQVHAIRNNNGNAVSEIRILGTGHTCGTITHTMDTAETGQKGRQLSNIDIHHFN
jgi:hypothetical protein